jgi:ODP family beta-lactamase
MAQITEVAPDLFRITTFVEPFNLQFSQFLARDEEPLLFHTGPRALFPAVKEAVASLIDPQTLRWIGFSHFESDECGTLPEWQKLAPQSMALCSMVGQARERRRLSLAPAGQRDDGRRGAADGEISLSVSCYAARSALLGNRPAV